MRAGAHSGPPWLHSGQLQFTRDGRLLVLGGPDSVTFVELRGDVQRRLSIPGVQSVAAFADQVWVATRSGALRRLGTDGRELGEHPVASAPDGVLIPTVIGGAAAIWSGRESVMLLDDLGSLAVVPGPFDAAIPIAGRRCARHAGPRLTLPSGVAVTLASATQIAAGSVVFDGAALALLTEHPRGRDLVAVVLASGRVLQSIAVPQGTIRIAARRGLAAVHDAARRIAILDLRFARHLGGVVTDDDIADFAIDPDGKLLAIQFASGDVEFAPVGYGPGGSTRLAGPESGELPAPDEPVPVPAAPAAAASASGSIASPAGAPPRSPPPGSPPAGAPPSAQAVDPPVDRPVDPPPADAPAALPAMNLDALEPRPVRAQLARAEAVAQLDREIRTVSLWTLRAIATAWDTRRLGYGNEGRHPYEHEVAALVGRNAGFATEYLTAAREMLAEHEAALAADAQHRAAATPIAELIDEFQLSPTAIDVLFVIAAPSLDGDVARLYGILSNDPGRAMVDELLVQHVLGPRVSRHDVAAELHPQATLVRLGIVGVQRSRPRPFAALEVDPVVLSRLRGEVPDLGATTSVRRADRALGALDLAPGVLASAATALARAARPARIAVRGRAGSGRRAALAAFAGHAGRSLGVIDATSLPRDAERFVDALQIALRRAQLAGLLPVIDRLEAVVFAGRNGVEVAHEILAAHPGPLAVLSSPGASALLPLGHVAIDLPALSETARLGVWLRALAGTPHWLRDVAGLAARYRIGPGVIHRAVTALTGHDPMAPCDDDIDGFLRQSRDLRLADHARRVEGRASWSDLVLPPDVVDSLRELVGRVRHRRTVFEDWGMGRTMSTSRGLTALFQGQPGTGKTLVAGVIARELGLDLYQVDLSKVMSKWLGETERNLATIFDAAEDGQVILLFDEADSLFAKRTEVRSSNDRYANLEVNYLLQRLDSFEGIAILTTNSGGSIDPAFKRRLSFRLSFPFPDEETRAELWRAHLPRELPRAGELRFDVIARKYQLSGGYIRNACLRAAFLAAQEETALQQHHLERAVALEFAEFGKLSTSGAIV